MQTGKVIKLVKEAALSIVKKLRLHNYQAYWVGGCVRNMVMGIPPEDIDVVTDALPETICTLFSHTIPVGAKFGVVLVVENDIPIEVATFRADDVYEDHRHPRAVRFSSMKEDALRRDFTINALFYNPIADKVIDYVDGISDIKKKLIRAVGEPEKRFAEDALRMLRAIRFASRFNFTIEPLTWTAIQKNKSLISEISADRIRDELIKMFTGPRAGSALRLLDSSGLLVEILPEIADMKGIPQPAEFHPEGNVFEHTALALDLLENPTPTLAFGVLLHDVGKPKTLRIEDRIRFDSHDKVGKAIADNICRRLKFSNKDREWIVALVSRHMSFLNVKEMRPSTLRRFLGAETIAEDLELHRIDCLASHRDLSNYEFVKQKLAEFKQQHKELIPPPLIKGKDLIAAGYKPGPNFQKILKAVAELQLEEKLKTKEEALKWVKKTFPLTEP